VLAPAGVTVSASAAVTSPRPEPVPVPVGLLLPAATVGATVMVRVDVAVLPLSVAGLNAAVTPVGAPTSESATSSVKLVRAIVIGTGPVAPSRIATAFRGARRAYEPAEVAVSVSA